MSLTSNILLTTRLFWNYLYRTSLTMIVIVLISYVFCGFYIAKWRMSYFNYTIKIYQFHELSGNKFQNYNDEMLKPSFEEVITSRGEDSDFISNSSQKITYQLHLSHMREIGSYISQNSKEISFQKYKVYSKTLLNLNGKDASIKSYIPSNIFDYSNNDFEKSGSSVLQHLSSKNLGLDITTYTLLDKQNLEKNLKIAENFSKIGLFMLYLELFLIFQSTFTNYLIKKVYFLYLKNKAKILRFYGLNNTILSFTTVFYGLFSIFPLILPLFDLCFFFPQNWMTKIVNLYWTFLILAINFLFCKIELKFEEGLTYPLIYNYLKHYILCIPLLISLFFKNIDLINIFFPTRINSLVICKLWFVDNSKKVNPLKLEINSFSLFQILSIYTFFLIFLIFLSNYLYDNDSFLSVNIFSRVMNLFSNKGNIQNQKNNQLIIEDLCKSYGFFYPSEILSNISFSVPYNTRVAIIGENGAGKSSLIECLLGTKSINKGKIINNVSKISQIGYCPQDPFFFEFLTVYENIEYFCKLKNIDPLTIKKFIGELELEKVSKSYPTLTSGGQQKKLSFLLSVLQRPRIIFLDEPTTGIDLMGKIEIKNILNDFCKNSIIFMSSHLLEDLDGFSQKILLLDKGKLRFFGNLDELRKIYNIEKNMLIVTVEDKGELPLSCQNLINNDENLKKLKPGRNEIILENMNDNELVSFLEKLETLEENNYITYFRIKKQGINEILSILREKDNFDEDFFGNFVENDLRKYESKANIFFANFYRFFVHIIFQREILFQCLVFFYSFFYQLQSIKNFEKINKLNCDDHLKIKEKLKFIFYQEENGQNNNADSFQNYLKDNGYSYQTMNNYPQYFENLSKSVSNFKKGQVHVHVGESVVAYGYDQSDILHLNYLIMKFSFNNDEKEINVKNIDFFSTELLINEKDFEEKGFHFGTYFLTLLIFSIAGKFSEISNLDSIFSFRQPLLLSWNISYFLSNTFITLLFVILFFSKYFLSLRSNFTIFSFFVQNLMLAITEYFAFMAILFQCFEPSVVSIINLLFGFICLSLNLSENWLNNISGFFRWLSYLVILPYYDMKMALLNKTFLDPYYKPELEFSNNMVFKKKLYNFFGNSNYIFYKLIIFYLISVSTKLIISQKYIERLKHYFYKKRIIQFIKNHLKKNDGEIVGAKKKIRFI